MESEVSPFLYRMFRRQLQNCRLKNDESTAVVTDLSSRRDYALAAMAAAADMGSDTFQVTIPYWGRGWYDSEGNIDLGGMLALSKPVLNSLKGVNLILDLTLEGFIHTPGRVELVKSGARVLRAGAQSPQVLSRLMPWSDEEAKVMKERVQRYASLLRRAKVMRVVSEAGTDFTAVLSPNTTFASYGFSDEPGRWDVWGQNMVSNYPVDSHGKVVFDVGDYNVTPFAMYHTSRVELIVEKNYVVEVRGEGFDARLIREHLAIYNDKNVYAISHVGWGLHKRAKWPNMATYDRSPDNKGVSGDEGRVFWGNFLFSTGPNHHIGRFTKNHYDVAMRGCSVYLDDQLVVDRGRVLGDE
jgi:2,5-dihydroxypyridine 5,6-dioxygenase